MFFFFLPTAAPLLYVSLDEIDSLKAKCPNKSQSKVETLQMLHSNCSVSWTACLSTAKEELGVDVAVVENRDELCVFYKQCLMQSVMGSFPQTKLHKKTTWCYAQNNKLPNLIKWFHVASRFSNCVFPKLNRLHQLCRHLLGNPFLLLFDSRLLGHVC